MDSTQQPQPRRSTQNSSRQGRPASGPSYGPGSQSQQSQNRNNNRNGGGSQRDGPYQQTQNDGQHTPNANKRPYSGHNPNRDRNPQHNRDHQPHHTHTTHGAAQHAGAPAAAHAALQALQPHVPSHTSAHSNGNGHALPPKPMPTPAAGNECITQVPFSSFPLHPGVQRAISEGLGYTYCTRIQSEVMPFGLQGMDALAKARTGTGKTIAFLAPALTKLLALPPGSMNGRICTLILTPTRELAQQITDETAKLLKFTPQLTCQVVVGGTNVRTDMSRMRSRMPSILVATPGRMLDLLSQEGFNMRGALASLQQVVLDEADTLLDMGFRQNIEKILRQLPPPAARQTQLFSATFPKSVEELARIALKPNYKVVDTVGNEQQTAILVEQRVMVVPFEDQLPQLLASVREHMASEPDYKVIVFFPTARHTQLGVEVFGKLGIKALEMHSRKSQAHRTRTATEFKDGSNIIMFTSDVSARGMDYPDVSLVLQVGLPSDTAQYTHRLGRTGRGGKEGMSVLLLSDFEESALPRFKGLPLTRIPTAPEQVLAQMRPVITTALTKVDRSTKGQAYQAWMGYYKSHQLIKFPSSVAVVNQANFFSRTLGCTTPPPIAKRTVGMMGLKGVPGLNIVDSLPDK